MTEPTPSWADAVHQILREQRVRQVPYVPDTGLARLISLVRSDAAMRAVPLTTEEEGVALAVGAWLGGERSALLLQSSGIGNCINMALLQTYPSSSPRNSNCSSTARPLKRWASPFLDRSC